MFTIRGKLTARSAVVQIQPICYVTSAIFAIFANEAFQGVLATGDIAQKCGDILFLIHRQPTKTDRKRATICDSDNPLLLSTKRQVCALLFSTATSLPGSVIPL